MISSRRGDVSVLGRDGDVEIASQHGDIAASDVTGKVSVNLKAARRDFEYFGGRFNPGTSG